MVVRPSKNVDVSIVVTFHHEGILAHATLRSIVELRKDAGENGISTELICACDNADESTLNTIRNGDFLDEGDQIVECHFGDPSANRNFGASVATGKYLTILDGDDYYSSNWISKSVAEIRQAPGSIIHPEMLVMFGEDHSYRWQVDQNGPYFFKEGLLVSNYWAQWMLCELELFRNFPYRETRAPGDASGYEDWHWNCETLGAGHRHLLAHGTVGFYRSHAKGRLALDKHTPVTFGATKLFEIDYNEQS